MVLGYESEPAWPAQGRQSGPYSPPIEYVPSTSKDPHESRRAGLVIQTFLQVSDMPLVSVVRHAEVTPRERPSRALALRGPCLAHPV